MSKRKKPLQTISDDDDESYEIGTQDTEDQNDEELLMRYGENEKVFYQK